MAASMPHTGCMSDRLHDHLTFGIRRGCVACAQVEADLAQMRASLASSA